MGEFDRRRGLLLARRAEIENELQAIDAEMTQFDGLGGGGVPPRRRGRGRPRGAIAPQMIRGGRGGGGQEGRRGRGRGRGGNEKSLASVLHSLLTGRTMSVAEMTQAAKQAGHKTKSKNFRVLVSLALLKNRDKFKRVGRGQYTAK